MKIYFERSGGFAGMVTSANVDTQTLPPSEAYKIQSLIENSRFFDLPSKPPQSPKAKKGAADYFTYKITVQNDEKEHTVQYNDINMQPNVKPLIDFLIRHNKK